MGNISKSKALIGIAFVVLVWGGTWPIYKVALEYTPPLLFAGMRTLLRWSFIWVGSFTTMEKASMEENVANLYDISTFKYHHF